MTPTPRQRAILEWLNRVYPHAGRMFETALWIAADERIPCRGRMIAHAYREICSVLLNEYSSNSREDLDGKLKDFVGEYRKLNINFEVPASSVPTPDASPTLVPEPFLKAADAVVRTHAATANARDRKSVV